MSSFASQMSVLDLARRLMAFGGPLAATVHGRDPAGRAAKLLFQLQCFGVSWSRPPEFFNLPEVGDEVLVTFENGGSAAAFRRHRMFSIVDRSTISPMAARGLDLIGAQAAPLIGLLLPAVQKMPPSAAPSSASPAAFPSYQGGVRVATGDVNGDWQAWLA